MSDNADCVCCMCRFWKLAKARRIGPGKEVFCGLCRFEPPRANHPTNGWPVTTEHDTCSAFELKAYATELA